MSEQYLDDVDGRKTEALYVIAGTPKTDDEISLAMRLINLQTTLSPLRDEAMLSMRPLGTDAAVCVLRAALPTGK